MKLGLVAHPNKKEAIEVAKKILYIVEEINNKGRTLELIIDEKVAEKVDHNNYRTGNIENMGVSALITIGGDGTMLRTLQKTDLPILGINVGSLGFLMDVPPIEVEEALEHLIEGNYVVEERARIMTLLNGKRLPDATNEAVIATSIPSKIQSFEFFIDMEWVQRIRADGIIISTPTGSTSYALSAGGAVLDPRVEAMEIVPIAPFRINSRPFVIPNTSTITLKVAHKTRTAQLVIDGAFRRTVRHKDELLFTRSKRKTRFIRFDTDFYRKYQEKIARERPLVRKKGK